MRKSRAFRTEDGCYTQLGERIVNSLTADIGELVRTYWEAQHKNITKEELKVLLTDAVIVVKYEL